MECCRPWTDSPAIRYGDVSLIDAFEPLTRGRCCGTRPPSGARIWSYSCAHEQFTQDRGVVVSRFEVGSPAWYEVAVDGPDIVMSFPGFAVFVFSAEQDAIRGYPERDTTALTMSHLLLDQVMPLLLAGAGHHILHASAVSVTVGEATSALVLLGDSGAGKSSTAYAASEVGADFLADDFVVVAEHGGRPSLARVDHRGARLWEESVSGLEPALLSERVSQHNSKRRVAVTSRPAPDTLPVLAVLTLEKRLPPGTAPTLEPMKPLGTTMRLLHHSFRLDPTDRVAQELTLDASARLAKAVPGFEVRMPADLRGLRSACRILLEKVLASVSEAPIR